MPILEVNHVKKFYGGVGALTGVDLIVQEASIVGIIGPNGAGKTTFFNCISGYTQPSSGQINFLGKTIVGKQSYAINRSGLARTFQGGAVFPGLNVRENVLVGLHSQRKDYKKNGSAIEMAYELLNFVGLADREEELAADLPHGLQSRLQIAVALATRPRLLLLDEPAAGMNPEETKELAQLIQKIKAKGVTVSIIEHNMDIIMEICQKIVVLNLGAKIAEGTPDEVKTNPLVIQAYLGREQGA